MTTVRLSRARARQVAVMAQLLDAERPRGILDAVSRLVSVQMDPMAVVARSEHLVLWSRLGSSFRPEELARCLYTERSLFEQRAFIYPSADFALHRPRMAGFPAGDTAYPRRIRQWLADNAAFRDYVVAEIERRGPLRARDLEDRSRVPWPSSGWTRARNVGQMLEFLAARGEVAVAGRQGNERVWDVAARVLPLGQAPVTPEEAERLLARRRLRALGIVARGRGPAVGVPVVIEGLPGAWVAEPSLLERPFAARTALLSPFDRLVYDRERALFGFEHRLEAYVPAGRRRWGGYVMPALHGDRIVARVDLRADRRQGVLRVEAVLPEQGAGRDDLDAVEAELLALAGWLGLRLSRGSGPAARTPCPD